MVSMLWTCVWNPGAYMHLLRSPHSPLANLLSSTSSSPNPLPLAESVSHPLSLTFTSFIPLTSAYRPIDSDPFYSRSPVSSFDKPRSPPTIRPRAKSKSKPSDIFIHPNYSNISRADAMAVEMGIHGDTDRVKSNTAAEDDNAWELGKGRAVARELLRGSASSHTRTASQQMLFRIEDGESEDEQG